MPSQKLPDIPPEVIDRVHDERDPAATEEDVRRAMLKAAAGPSAVPCPSCRPCLLCGGIGRVDPETAQHWSVRNLPTQAPPADDSETTLVEEVSR